MNSGLLLQAISSLAPSMDAGTAMGVYAAIQETSDKMRKKGWLYPHACFIRESINSAYANIFTADMLNDNSFPHTFNHAFSLLRPLSLDDFLRLFPGYVTQIDRTMDALKSIEAIHVKCRLIYLAKAEWLRAESYPNNDDSYPLEQAIESYVSQYMPYKMWRELVCAVNCYSFSYNTRTLKPASDTHKTFSSYNAPPEYEIALYGSVRSLLMKTFIGKKTDWEKYITNGAHYMRKALSQNPKIDALAMDNAINTAAESIGKIELPTDFLEAVLINAKNNDSKIENDFIFSRTIETFYDDSSILVINPAPDFLKIYPKTHLSRTTFVVPYEPMAWILKSEFETAEFVSFAEYYNRYFPSSAFSEVLFFGRDLKTDAVFNLLEPLQSFATSNTNLHAFLPAGYIPNLFYTQESKFAHWSLQSIDLLPLSTITSSPKKKILLHAKNISNNSLVLITDYELYMPKKTLPNRVFIRPKSSLEIALTSAAFNAKHIYRIYNEALSKPLVPSRDEPKAYAFTDDITFWYTISDSPKTFGEKVEAYVCYFPTREQLKRRHLLRGSKIKGSYASISKLSSETSIEDWCENTLPYKARIHSSVIKAFKKDDTSLLSGTITLKTLWYLSLDSSNSKAVSADKAKTVAYDEKERDLFISSIGSLRLCDDLAQYEDAIDNHCTNHALAYRSWVWNTISSLWDFAIKKGWQKTNPIKSVALSFREKAFDDRGVRSALLKKTFHSDEEMCLLDFLYKAIHTDSEYLAVLIRFYTGLEPNIVSALTWGDLHKITGTNVYQFWIYQQFTNGGTIPVPLKYSEDYRRIPLVTSLSNALNTRRDEIMKLGISVQKLKTCQIIAPNDHLLGSTERIINPRKINELSKAAVRAIGISEIVVDLPAENDGTKETNLTDYHGDIFQTNFRYHANTKAGLTDAQLRYALGHKQNTPYGNNYCDFANDFCQIAIYEKLCRWDNSHKTVSHNVCQMQYENTAKPLIVNGINDSDTTSAILSFTVPSHQTITVSAHSPLGLSAAVTLVSNPGKGSENNG